LSGEDCDDDGEEGEDEVDEESTFIPLNCEFNEIDESERINEDGRDDELDIVF